MSNRPVLLLQRASSYVGPALAKRMAQAGYDLALHAPHPGQVDQLNALGANAIGIDVPLSGEGSDATDTGWKRLVSESLEHFGRIDSVSLFPPSVGSAVVTGPLLDSSVEQLRELCSYIETTVTALQHVIPHMRDRGGQILVFTSDAGAKPVANWSIYGAARAGQNFLVQATALEHASEGICINTIGSKNALFSGFPGAPVSAITDDKITSGDWSRALENETPLKRLGTMNELAAFAQVLLDGSNRFQTAQYFSYSGGWNASL